MSLIRKNNKRGFGYMIVISFTIILLIFFVVLGKVKSGQQFLQSKTVRRYVASTLCETALNCIIAELNSDRAFSTHWYFKDKGGKDKDNWVKPVKKRDTYLGNMGKIYVNGISNGLYTGGSDLGEFKAKFAIVYGAKGNAKTKTLLEQEMYERVEIVVKTGSGKKGNTTCRKLTALLERRNPAAEHILFDGEMLDVGALGPFSKDVNPIRAGRLYGYQWITFNTAGGSDRGSELYDTEKIETPGMIRGLKTTRIQFSNGKSFSLSSRNDSAHIKKFKIFDGYFLDGAHGAHPIKFSRLPKERLRAKAKRYKKTYGLIIKKGTLPFGKYKNPYNTHDQFVDLDFGDYFSGEREKKKSSSATADPDADESGNTKPPKKSDDPDIIKKKHGKKILIYSEVPLRIWGCPDRPITIYSEKDIVIGGDFNQSPLTLQDYPNDKFTDYKTKLTNGYRGNKVGALVMSEGRILVDLSHPTLFVKNEMKSYFLYCLGMALHPSSSAIEEELKESFCPVDVETRKGIVGLGGMGPDGNLQPRYGTIAWLYNNKTTKSGPAYVANTSDLTDFFTPGPNDKPRFGIINATERKKIIETVMDSCRKGGDLPINKADEVFDMAWAQAIKEENDNPKKNAGAMGLMSHMFDEAKASLTDGINMPEISINAALVSSTRRSSSWKIGNTSPKTNWEIGNTGSLCYLPKPAFIIEKICGSIIRIASKKPKYFISGSKTPKNILRRLTWDKTNLSNPTFKPLEMPYVFNIINYSEEQISSKVFDKF